MDADELVVGLDGPGVRVPVAAAAPLAQVLRGHRDLLGLTFRLHGAAERVRRRVHLLAAGRDAPELGDFDASVALVLTHAEVVRVAEVLPAALAEQYRTARPHPALVVVEAAVISAAEAGRPDLEARLTVAEVAAKVGVTERAVRFAVVAGTLPERRLGRVLWFTADDVAEYRRRRRSAA